ncbi:unnamed protein product [Prorocentrum cordatum]|uniref:Uncharacterized protein n=1 Tax=Prorocentrum cordatum TaxID=2364126 RepID=A0ABN9T452_9DINO|nr:unnamed protein product [Polarella glacialis]
MGDDEFNDEWADDLRRDAALVPAAALLPGCGAFGPLGADAPLAGEPREGAASAEPASAPAAAAAAAVAAGGAKAASEQPSAEVTHRFSVLVEAARREGKPKEALQLLAAKLGLPPDGARSRG